MSTQILRNKNIEVNLAIQFQFKTFKQCLAKQKDLDSFIDFDQFNITDNVSEPGIFIDASLNREFKSYKKAFKFFKFLKSLDVLKNSRDFHLTLSFNTGVCS